MMETLSRKEATSRGLQRYFTGVPCNHGHVAERYTSTRNCLACQKIHDKGRHRATPGYQKKWYEENSERVCKENAQRYRKMLRLARNVYGSHCQSCGNDKQVVLQWHHRNGRENAVGNDVLLRQIIKTGKPLDDVMLLCANCHIEYNILDGTKARKNQGRG
jgi:hypothetical protein